MSEPNTQPTKQKTQHRHPACYRRIWDPTARNGEGAPGERVKREFKFAGEENLRTHYHHTCPACREADQARTKLSEKELARTMFLIPPDYDGMVAMKYLNQRYGADLALSRGVQQQFYVKQVAALAATGYQIVVVTRRPREESVNSIIQLSAATNRNEETKIAPAEKVHEIVESAPIKVAECFGEISEYQPEINSDELVERLAEVAYPLFIQRRDDDVRRKQTEPKILMLASV